MHEAKLAMAIKLFEMKRLSSGMSAALIGMSRVEFLAELHRYGVPMIDLDQNDLAQDLIPDSFQTETNYGKLRGSIFRWSIVHGKADPS